MTFTGLYLYLSLDTCYTFRSKSCSGMRSVKELTEAHDIAPLIHILKELQCCLQCFFSPPKTGLVNLHVHKIPGVKIYSDHFIKS